MARLLLIDGHSQAYRAFFGMKTPLTTRTGEVTSAVYGFARKLLSVLREYQPAYVAVAFDTGDTWRHAEFAGYKATRERMPDEMRSQMARIEELLAAFNIPIVTYANYEADDVLGTLARQAAAQGVDVLILTGDRDMFQLVDERVQILYTSGGPNPQTSIYGLPEVHERYGLNPQQFIDLKALTGDSSDNIPGVPGIGEKTAGRFLQQYGTLESLYEHAAEISGPKTRQSLIDAHEQVLLNKRLVTIATDLDLRYDPDACRLRNYDREDVVALFTELEFRSLLKELPQADDEPPVAVVDGQQMALFGGEPAATGGAATGGAQSSAGQAEAHPGYTVVQDLAALERLATSLQSAQRISFDVETTSQDAHQAVLVGLGIATTPGQAAYIPVGHADGVQLAWDQVCTALQTAMADARIPKVAHNGKYDLTVCQRHGLAIQGPVHDTMTLAWLLDPASRSLGLKAQAAAELDWQMTELGDLIGSGRKQITMDQVPIAQAAPYCCADVDATLQLFERLAPRVQAQGMWDLYTQLELPLLPVLADMEKAGVLLDTAFLGQMSLELSQRLAALERDLFATVGHGFNLRSTQQLSQVIFDEMNFPTHGMKKTASGHYSTAVATLEALAAQADLLNPDQQRVLAIIFEQRLLEKLRGTYVDALPTMLNPETGRVHTSFSQTGAVTGRMSSSSPNLQNIPIRTELGREIRRAFIAPPGWLLISADYSQVELRVLAHIAQEAGLLEAFHADQDIHAATAARLFGVAIDQVDRQQRGLAKTINFATIYGVSAFGLSSRTEMSRQQAEQFLDQYFITYPRIRTYIADTIAMAGEKGYVQTLLGRKRFFPELANRSLPFNQRQAVERAAINAPIQGTAADIMKLAMIRLHGELRQRNLRTRMLLQVHDELVLETPQEEQAVAAQLVRETMQSAYKLDIPLKVDVEVGPNWYELAPA